MSDIGDKLDALGTTLKTQFNLLATGDLDDPAQAETLQELSTRGRALQTELAQALGVEIEAPAETLAAIIARARAQGETRTANLEEALAVLNAMNTQLPQNACPTVEAVQDAARQALKPPAI